jgi:hypothetical protein
MDNGTGSETEYEPSEEEILRVYFEGKADGAWVAKNNYTYEENPPSGYRNGSPLHRGYVNGYHTGYASWRNP